MTTKRNTQKKQPQSAENVRPIWETLAELGKQVPKEAWETLPPDFIVNHDHYLYGTPKVEG